MHSCDNGWSAIYLACRKQAVFAEEKQSIQLCTKQIKTTSKYLHIYAKVGSISLI